MGDAHCLRIALRKDNIEAEMKNLDREIDEERKKRHSELRAAARKNMIYRIFRSGGHKKMTILRESPTSRFWKTFCDIIFLKSFWLLE